MRLDTVLYFTAIGILSGTTLLPSLGYAMDSIESQPLVKKLKPNPPHEFRVNVDEWKNLPSHQRPFYLFDLLSERLSRSPFDPATEVSVIQLLNSYFFIEADVEQREKLFGQVIQVSARKKSLKMVQLLAKSGFPISQKNLDLNLKLSVLYSINNHDLELLKYLIESLKNPFKLTEYTDEEIDNLILRVVVDDIEVAEEFFTHEFENNPFIHGFRLAEDFYSLLLDLAADCGDLSVFRYIESLNPQKLELHSSYDGNPFEYAVARGHFELVSYLAEKYPHLALIKPHYGHSVGSDSFLSDRRSRPLLIHHEQEYLRQELGLAGQNLLGIDYSILHGDLKVLTFLLDKFPHILERDRLAQKKRLSLAISGAHVEVLRELLRRDTSLKGVLNSPDYTEDLLYLIEQYLGEPFSGHFRSGFANIETLLKNSPKNRIFMLLELNEINSEFLNQILIRDRKFIHRLFFETLQAFGSTVTSEILESDLNHLMALADLDPKILLEVTARQETPLHLLLSLGSKSTGISIPQMIPFMNFLLNRAPELLNKQNQQGQTALHLAWLYAGRERKGSGRLLKFLFDSPHLDLDLKDERGKTAFDLLMEPLMRLSDSNLIAVIKKIKAEHVELVKLQTSSGITFLKMSIARGSVELARELLELIPSPEYLVSIPMGGGCKGQTPLDLAKETLKLHPEWTSNFKELIEILESLSAFHSQDVQGLLSHVLAGKTMDLNLFARSLEQQEFNQEKLNDLRDQLIREGRRFQSDQELRSKKLYCQLRLQHSSQEVESSCVSNPLDAIRQVVENRLLSPLAGACVRSLGEGLKKPGFFYTNQFADVQGANPMNSLSNADSWVAHVEAFRQNPSALCVIWKTLPAGDRLDTQLPSQWVNRLLKESLDQIPEVNVTH